MSYPSLTFCFFFETSTSIIIGLTSQLVDADARENTNAQTQTRHTFQIIIKYQSLLHQKLLVIPNNIFFVYHSTCVLNNLYSLWQKTRNQSPEGHPLVAWPWSQEKHKLLRLKVNSKTLRKIYTDVFQIFFLHFLFLFYLFISLALHSIEKR